jgi:hypothetical protein
MQNPDIMGVAMFQQFKNILTIECKHLWNCNKTASKNHFCAIWCVQNVLIFYNNKALNFLGQKEHTQKIFAKYLLCACIWILWGTFFWSPATFKSCRNDGWMLGWMLLQWLCSSLTFYYLFLFLAALGFELRISHLLGLLDRHSTAWATLPALFCDSIFFFFLR